MTSGTAEGCSAHPSTLRAQYEILRMAALGEALAPEARNGLLLFLRRGMWAWARTLAAANAPQEPTHGRSFSTTPPCEREVVIHLLAQMAMKNTYERRAP
jgi:hypothetical protein